MNHYTHKTLAQAAGEIRNADQLLFRGHGLVSKLISIAGRGRHTHAAKAVWFYGAGLFCAEIRERKGGRIVTLESQVKRYPAQIDVYETNPMDLPYNRERAVEFMVGLAGSDYGWWNVWRAALLHLPLLRLVYRPSFDDSAVSEYPPHYSHACAMADRIGGGIDPVPGLADLMTEPADLARSRFYKYRFTLVP